MHLFECEATFEADPDAVWKVWTDVARWPEWDVSKEIAQLDGPFEAGTRGWGPQRGNLGGALPLTEGGARRARGSGGPGPPGKGGFDHTPQPGPRGRGRGGKRGAGPGGG